MKPKYWLSMVVAAGLLTVVSNRYTKSLQSAPAAKLAVISASQPPQTAPSVINVAPTVPVQRADVAQYNADLEQAEQDANLLRQMTQDARQARHANREQERAETASWATYNAAIQSQADASAAVPAAAPAPKFIVRENVDPVDPDQLGLGYTHTIVYSDGTSETVTNSNPSAQSLSPAGSSNP